MSGHEPSDEKQGKYQGWRGSDGRTTGGGRVKKYFHAIREDFLSTNTSNELQLQEVEKRSGASVHFDCNPSPVPGMKIVVIQGVQSQIEAAVQLINEMIATGGTLSEEAQEFWLHWVEAAFPDLDSRAYFLPPVYVNRVPMTRQSISGQDVLVLQAAPGQAGQSSQLAMISPTTQPPLVMESDIRDDTALQRVLVCLQEISEKNKEVMVGMRQLRFGQYLDEPCYSAAVAYLPLPKNLPNSTSRDRQGDFDVLLIHRSYSFVVCEVKSVGLNAKHINLLGEELDIAIRKKLKEAVLQLDKAEAMLSHLVSDIAPGLRITKTIAFPNLTARQVQQAISSDSQLIQDLCRCLGTSDPADITGLCLCCDQLSDPKTPCDVSSHVLRELGHWWQRCVTGAGPDPHMTHDVYKKLIARFCGPATTVSVPCTSPPRLSVKTLGQAVWCTGECYTAVITLFPEQIHLLNKADPRVFVSGPPGTGKTVVLLLMAIKWLREDHDIYIVSTWWGSRAVCKLLYHLLLQTVNKEQTAVASSGQLHLLEFDFPKDKDMEKAVNDLSQAAKGGQLYIIADEAGPENTSVWPLDSSGHEQSKSEKANEFGIFCGNLLKKVPYLHLWAASCFHRNAPSGWQVEYLTRPLRSPPTIVRELQKTWKQSTSNQKKLNQTAYNQKAHNYEMSSQETGDQKADNQRKEDLVTDDQEIDSQDTYKQETDNQKTVNLETDKQETNSQKTDRQETNNQKTQNQETDNQESRSQKASSQHPVYFVQPYSERGFPDHTDGPPIRRLYHGGQGHSGNNPGSCITCGREVASFLHSLHTGDAAISTTVTTTNSGTLNTCIQWRDMLVLYYWRDFTEDSDIVTGLREAGIPVRLMTDDDIEDVATARSDVVWMADGERVRGLERKVVVCVDPRVETVRLHHMSRCTSQLMIVLVNDEPSVSNSSYLTKDAVFLQLNTTDLTKTGLRANSFFDL